MNTTENLISNGCPAPAPQPTNNIVKPIKFPAQPQEWKIVSLRECPTPDTMQQCETPDQAAAYWKSHIPDHPYFNSECECLVVFILNTRRRIKGHYLVSIGTMDTILCHPRERTVHFARSKRTGTLMLCWTRLAVAPRTMSAIKR